MKKKLLLAILIGIYCNTSNAQQHFGARIALVESTIRTHSSSGAKLFTGISGGIFSQIEIGKRFIVRPELSYLLKGVRNVFTGIPDNKEVLHDISIPLLIGLKANPNINLFLGPQIDFLLKASSKSSAGSEEVTDLYNRTELSGTIGAALKLNKKLGVDLRYSQGLTPLVSFEITDGQGTVTEVIKRRSYVFLVGLSYLFKQ